MKYTLLLCALLLFSFSFSQSPKYRVISIPVEKNTIQLREPWVGGMNSPQFSSINLNNDSLPDLFIFDKVGDKVLTYINNGNGTDSNYTYAPQYEELFPPDLFSWALIRDYNHDNIPDIFTHANTGSQVFKGQYRNGVLHFDTVCPLLSYRDNTFDVNIWTGVDDIPVFIDMNFDGDIDVLSYSIIGARIEYFENQTKENEGNPHYDIDSFKYLLMTSCWGLVSQNSLSNSINMHDTCTDWYYQAESIPIPTEARHSGNTLFSFDDNYDHDIDLLNGNIGYDNLAFLENCGDSSFASICINDSLFPSCNTPIAMPTYPAAFNADVDNDGLEDLLISPNARAGGRDVHNVMLYKNINNHLCNFQYQSDSFLVEHQLDFGTDSKAVFFDFNGDGLKDIIVGNLGYFRPFQSYQSTLAYLENVGTATSPSFKLRDTNYGNFSSFLRVGMNPAFGDLDGDGKADLVCGNIDGTLDYFKNAGSTVASFPVMTRPIFDTLDAGQYSAPFIYDVNGDSLNDLVVGKKDGKLSYYWNMGTRTSPLFKQDSVNTNFGNVNVTVPGYIEGYSQPFIMKDSAGNMLLFVGSLKGDISEYIIDPSKLRGGSFTRIDANLLKHNVGSKSTVSIADINNDGKLEYLVGNSRGGLLMYSDSLWDPGTLLGVKETENGGLLKIYPNPAKDYVICEAGNHTFVNPKVEVFNLLGERVNADAKISPVQIVVNTANLHKGFYLIRVSDKGQSLVGKILVE
jgi:hypothetical protein